MYTEFIFSKKAIHHVNNAVHKFHSLTQLTFTCSKSTIETPGKIVKYVQS